MTFIYFYELVLLFFIFHHNFRSNNVDNFFKGYVTRNNFSRNKFLNYDRFIYHDVNIFNISHTNVLSSSDRCYPFSFHFCIYSFFIYSAFNDIFYVNNINNIFDNNLYITGLLNRDNKFLYCNCKVTGESITLFQQENKFKVYKILIISENNSVFLIVIFIIFRSFSRKQNKCLRLCYFTVFWFSIVSLKFQINNGFHFNFSLLQKCQKNHFFNLETLTCCHIQHITLHKNFAILAVTNLKYKNYTNYYKFLLLLTGDVSLNTGTVERSPDISSTMWKPLNKNKKGLHFLHININSLLSIKDEVRCIANKTKAAIIGITESKLYHTVPDSKVNFPGYKTL